MTLVRLGFWSLFPLLFVGCRSLSDWFAPKDEAKHTKERTEKDKPARDPYDRDPGAALFPAELVSPGVRPRPEVTREDIRPPALGVADRPKDVPVPKWPDPPFGPTTVQRIEPPPEREPVVEALHAILAGKHKDALNQLGKYDRATQELLLRVLPALAQLHHKGLDRLSPQEVAVLQEQLQSLFGMLRPRLDLVIDRMCLCEDVREFGVYKPLPETHVFRAATRDRPGDQVQLYAELRNFASEPQGDHFETRLSSSVEIRDPSDKTGAKLWYYRFDNKKELLHTRSQLNDYFGKYAFYVPHLPPGIYVLTLQIADETRPDNRRVARKSIEFRVASP